MTVDIIIELNDEDLRMQEKSNEQFWELMEDEN